MFTSQTMLISAVPTSLSITIISFYYVAIATQNKIIY